MVEKKMMKQLKMLMEELEVYQEDDNDVNFLAIGGYDGSDNGIEIVQFTKNSPYILRIKRYERYEESNALYFTFENEKSLVDFLEENYR